MCFLSYTGIYSVVYDYPDWVGCKAYGSDGWAQYNYIRNCLHINDDENIGESILQQSFHGLPALSDSKLVRINFLLVYAFGCKILLYTNNLFFF